MKKDRVTTKLQTQPIVDGRTMVPVVPENPTPVHNQTHEYTVSSYDARACSDENLNGRINAFAALGWRLVAVTGDVVRTLYFERAVK